MGKIRAFVEDDIPQVAALHTRIFPHSRGVSLEKLGAYFNEIFFKNPWYDKDFPSLVYQEGDGTIVGFLGIMPRQMNMAGRPIRVAITTQFMVEPGARAGLAAVELLRKLFSGPQDLSITDGAIDLAKKIWEGLGGKTAYLYSIHWTRPLRPSRYVMSRLRERRALAPFEFISRPFCAMLDALAVRTPGSPFRRSDPGAVDGDLSAEVLLRYLPEFSPGLSLRPVYDEMSLSWLLERAAQKKSQGDMRQGVVQNARSQIIGWYLFYLKKGGVSEVLQVVAKSNSMTEVLDHLFYSVWRQGSIAVSGRVEPLLMQSLSERYCLLERSGAWFLVHSKQPELLHAVQSGDAFLTRLEGEWWMRFQGEQFE